MTVTVPADSPARKPSALVIVNPHCRGGRRRDRWRHVQVHVFNCYDAVVVATERASEVPFWVEKALQAGVRMFIAAGGDGTVNSLLNAILTQSDLVSLNEVTLGAVGLGSSNDFHKPFGRRIRGVPLRMRDPCPQDVVRVRFEGADGVERERCFLVSASVGVVADANAFFNSRGYLMRALKACSVDAAVFCSAVSSLCKSRGQTARIEMGAETTDLLVANLSVMKGPFLGGFLRYDASVGPCPGSFAVHLLEHRGTWSLFREFWHVLRGKSRGQSNARHFVAPCFRISFLHDAPLELDGEIVRARWASFEVLPGRVRVCQA